jgi:hypothetical protein
MAENPPIDVKMIEVEPVDEGVRLKPKRQLTEAQLANLKKGREKLAEKRKAEKEQKEKESESGSVAKYEAEAEPDSQPALKTESQTQTDPVVKEEEEDDETSYPPCSIM